VGSDCCGCCTAVADIEGKDASKMRSASCASLSMLRSPAEGSHVGWEPL